jgi:hypothetical protein
MSPIENIVPQQLDEEQKFQTNVLPHLQSTFVALRTIRTQQLPEDGITFRDSIDPTTGLTELETILLVSISDSITYLPPDQQDTVWKAVGFALEKHALQKRKSEDPYAVHPLWIVAYAASKRNPYDILVLDALHDVVEDANVTIDEITVLFSKKIGSMVEVMSKFKSKNLRSETTDERARLKTLLSIIKTPKIAIAKIYDRLHNILTLEFMKEQKQQEIARETLKMYIPLARLMGMTREADIMENICTVIVYPDLARTIQKVQPILESLHTPSQTGNLRVGDEIRQRFPLVQGYPHHIHIPCVAEVARSGHPFVYLDIGMSEGNYWLQQMQAFIGVMTNIKLLQEDNAFDRFSAIASSPKSFLRTYTVDMQIPGVNLPGGQPLTIRMQITSAEGYWIDQASCVDAVRLPNPNETSSAFAEKQLRGTQRWKFLKKRLGKQSNSHEKTTSTVIVEQLAWRASADMICINGCPPKGKKHPWFIRKGSTVMDLAVSISPNGWMHAISARINGEDVPLGTTLQPYDEVSIVFGSERTVDHLQPDMFNNNREKITRSLGQMRKKLNKEGKPVTDLPDMH